MKPLQSFPSPLPIAKPAGLVASLSLWDTPWRLLRQGLNVIRNYKTCLAYLLFVSIPLMAAVVVTVSPKTATLEVSTSTTFTATVTGSSNTAVTWTATGGTITSGGVYTAPATPGTYTVTATSQANAQKKDTATVTVIPPPVAISAVAPANPVVEVSSTTTFSATVTNATDTSITWSATGGTIIPTTGVWTAPSTPGTFTITATANADNSKTSSTTATVVGLPEISSFTATPATLTSLGSSATLAYTFANGTGTISNGVGTVTSGGTSSVSPSNTTTYTLTVTNVFGKTASASQTVSVVIGGAPNASITTPLIVTSGEANRTASVPYSSQWTYAWTITGGTITGGANNYTVYYTPGAVGNATLNCTVTNPFLGTNAVGSQVISVVAAPSITWSYGYASGGGTNSGFTVEYPGMPNPTSVSGGQFLGTVPLGTTITLKGTFTNGTGSIDNEVGAVTSGVGVTTIPTKDTLYTLTVTNAAGTKLTAELPILVTSPYKISVSPIVNPLISTQEYYRAEVLDRAGTTYLWSTTGGNFITYGNANSTVHWHPQSAPATPGEATLQCVITNSNGVFTTTKKVKVRPRLSISSFTASSLYVPEGQSVTLTGIFPNGWGKISESLYDESDNNISASYRELGTVTSGVPLTVWPTVLPNLKSKYELSVDDDSYDPSGWDGTARSVGAYASVYVQSIQTPNSSITATSMVATGATGLTASVPNKAGSTFQWSINGGTITAGPTTATVSYTAGSAGTLVLQCIVTNAAGTTTGTKNISVLAAPVITSFTATASSITTGASTTLTGVFNGGSGEIDWGTGWVTSGTATTVSPLATRTFTLTVTNEVGATATATATVTVTASATGITSTSPVNTGATGLTASVPSVGGASYAWTLTGGTITGGSGTNTISYTAGTVGTLSLQCVVTKAGTTTRTGSVSVIAAPSISSFTATPVAIAPGQSTTLSANFAGGVGRLDQGIGPVTNGVGISVSPIATTTYLLTVKSATNTTATLSLTVTVVPAPNATIYANSVAHAGGNAQGGFTWNASVPTQTGCTYQWTVTGATIFAGESTNSSVVWYQATGSQVIVQCTVTNAAGMTATNSKTIDIVPVPQINFFMAIPAGVKFGESANLTFSFTGGTGRIKTYLHSGEFPASYWTIRNCQDSVYGQPVISGQLINIPSVTEPLAFELIVESPCGETVRSSLLYVGAEPNKVVLTPTSTSLPVGYIQQFLAASPFVDLAFKWAVRELGGGSITQTGAYTGPAKAGTYHVEVADAADAYNKATATVVVPLSVDVNPPSIDLQSGLSASFTASVAGSDDVNVTWNVQEGITGGTISSTGLYTAPATPGTYHVVATSTADSSKIAIAAVNVSATPHAVVTVTPYGVELNKGGSQAFTATVSGYANQAVTWAASGGSITSGGVYTAPTAFGTYTVTATSVADPTASDNATVVVKAISGTDRTFTYDLNGNLISDGQRTFEWDALDRLLAVVKGTHRTEFSYDFMDRRVRVVEKENSAVVSDSRYLWDGLEILEQRDPSGGNVVQQFFNEGFQDVTGGYTYTRDHLGSIREVADSSQTVRARYDYDPYGRMTKVSGDKDATFLYTGHFWHPQSGLYLAPYRAYDPNLGRWISRDPIGEKGGLNLYAYVKGNPINFVDPLGHTECDIQAAMDFVKAGNAERPPLKRLIHPAEGEYGDVLETDPDYGKYFDNKGGKIRVYGATLYDKNGQSLAIIINSTLFGGNLNRAQVYKLINTAIHETIHFDNGRRGLGKSAENNDDNGTGPVYDEADFRASGNNVYEDFSDYRKKKCGCKNDPK